MCFSQNMQRAIMPMGNVESAVMPKFVRNVNDKIGPAAVVKRLSGQNDEPASPLSAPTAMQQAQKADPAAAFYLPQNS